MCQNSYNIVLTYIWKMNRLLNKKNSLPASLNILWKIFFQELIKEKKILPAFNTLILFGEMIPTRIYPRTIAVYVELWWMSPPLIIILAHCLFKVMWHLVKSVWILIFFFVNFFRSNNEDDIFSILCYFFFF